MSRFFIISLLTAFWAAAPDTLTVIAVGDVMYAHHGTRFLDKHGCAYPFEKIGRELERADIRICNLEVSIADTGIPFDKTYTYRMPERHAPALRMGGFDMVHLANNHILDFGEAALLNTLRLLDSLGIAHAGAGKTVMHARRPAVVERKGQKIGLLSYSNTFPREFWADSVRPGTAFGHAAFLREDIPAALEKTDLLFVSFHWGAEKMTLPKDYQKKLGRLAVDLGAHAVFGHHPHVLQSMEIYKGRLIAYSLGNFSFSTWTRSVWDSALLRCYFSDKRFVRAEVVPVLVNNFEAELQTRVLTGSNALKSLKKLSVLCDSLGTDLIIRDGRGYLYP